MGGWQDEDGRIDWGKTRTLVSHFGFLAGHIDCCLYRVSQRGANGLMQSP